jgi:hypothetical protein
MSAKLTKALEFSNYRITLNNQQDALRAKTQSLLSYSINGGTFSIDRNLITFCNMLQEQKHKTAVLLDIYENPIEVNLDEFVEEITSRYFEVTNEYLIEFEKLKQARKTHRVLDLNEDGE